MNVALFASAFHPSVGGVEELVRQQARYYLARGDDVCVLTNRWPRDLPTNEEVDGIDVYRLPFRIPEGSIKAHVSYALTHATVRRQVQSILRRHNTQVIHVQCVSTNGYYARLAAHDLRVPMIVTTQGERTMDAQRVYETSTWMNRILRDCVGAAAHVTACSQNTLDDLHQWYGQALGSRSSVIYNGVRLADFDCVAPYQHPRPYVLGIGRWVTQKGFDVLLKAFDAVGNSEFDLLLAGTGAEEQALRALVETLPSKNRIHLLGRADRPTAVALFKGCSVFVLPSRLEPMGIVNLEAMAAARPVVASRTGGVPEIVLDDETGLLVTPGDVDDLARALGRILADEGLRQRLGHAAFNRAQAFDWPLICEQYRTLYRNTMP